MEIAIAIGLGAWFVLAGIVSFISVSRSFKSNDRTDNEK